MSTLRQLLCPHRHRRFWRDEDGILQLVCERCGDPVVALTREATFKYSGPLAGQRQAARQERGQ